MSQLHKSKFYILVVLLLALAGCAPQSADTHNVVLVVDGGQQTLVLSRQATVSEVLERADVTLGELDRVNPPTFTETEDGLVITVVRVEEEVVIEQETLPFNRTTVRNDNLPYGETRLLQGGVNGLAEVTYRISYEDGAEVSRSEVRQVVLTPPQDEVVMVGSAGQLPSVTINGTLVFISGGNAWMMRQNSANRRPLTTGGGLDGRVFALSPDGARLLFSRTPGWEAAAQLTPPAEEEPTEDEEDGLTASPPPSPTPEEIANEEAPGLNTLWAILDIGDPSAEAIELSVEDVLYGEWVPGEERTIVYSTAEPRASFPGWQANNDLWQARVSASGIVSRRETLVAPSGGGIYGWYGTSFSLNGDGVRVAWAQPDGVGMLVPVTDEEDESPDAYGRALLLAFAPANAYDFVWLPGVSWSPDGEFIATTTHGNPLGDEAPEDSPVYHLTILAADGSLAVDAVRAAGMWSLPQYSPLRTTENGNTTGWLAFLKAIEPLNSVAGRYQLAVADRDGSNQRLVYPPSDQTGLLPQTVAWSPDARQVALVHQGDLFIVDISSGLAQQLSGDGLSSHPRWSP